MAHIADEEYGQRHLICEDPNGVLDDIELSIEPFAGRNCLCLRQPWVINRMQRLDSRLVEPWTFR